MSAHQNQIKDLAISGFSGGAGKTFLIHRVIEFLQPAIEFSVSTTTRPPRKNDREGIDYNFVDVNTFQAMIRDGSFLEFNEPKGGVYYGTTLKEYGRIRESGKAVAFDVDYAGVMQLKQSLAGAIHSVLLMPNVETRWLWMEKRGDMSLEEMERRIAYSESVEKPFFDAHKEKYFDTIIDPYRNDIQKVPFLVNEIANKLFINEPIKV